MAESDLDHMMTSSYVETFSPNHNSNEFDNMYPAIPNTQNPSNLPESVVGVPQVTLDNTIPRDVDDFAQLSIPGLAHQLENSYSHNNLAAYSSTSALQSAFPHTNHHDQGLIVPSNSWRHQANGESFVTEYQTPLDTFGVEGEGTSLPYRPSDGPSTMQDLMLGVSFDIDSFQGPSMITAPRPSQSSNGSRRGRHQKPRGARNGVQKKSSKVHPRICLAQFENALQEHSKSSPYFKQVLLQVATLLRPVKQLIDNEIFHGEPSQPQAENMSLATNSMSQESISVSEVTDSGYRTEDTSISSTPRPHKCGNVDFMSQNSQLPSNEMEDTTIYPCSATGCGETFKNYSDWKRHEEIHWPLHRYMCLDCIFPQLDSNGHLICQFCQTAIIAFSKPAGHYLQCMSAREKAATFTRKYGLNNHLRKQHGMETKAANQRSRDWHYPIPSDWPRQCQPCRISFQTWEERVKHIATKHYQRGDHRPQGFYPKPKDDDSDDGDDEDDNSKPSHKKAAPYPSTFSTMPQNQSQNQASSAGPANGSWSHYTLNRDATAECPPLSRYFHERFQEGAGLGAQIHRRMSVPLERYLNDNEDTTAGILSAQTFSGAINCSSHPSDLLPHSNANEGDSHSPTKEIISQSDYIKTKFLQLSPHEVHRPLVYELEKRGPPSKNDLHVSKESVKATGLLPAIIIAVVRSLKTTENPSLTSWESSFNELSDMTSKTGDNLTESISLGPKRLGAQTRTTETATDGILWPKDLGESHLGRILHLAILALKRFCSLATESERISVLQEWASYSGFTEKMYEAYSPEGHGLRDALTKWAICEDASRYCAGPDLHHFRRECALWTTAMLTSAGDLSTVFTSTIAPIPKNWQRKFCAPLVFESIPLLMATSKHACLQAPFERLTAAEIQQPMKSLAETWPKLKLTLKEDELLVDLRENRDLTWTQIAEFFPGCSSAKFQVRYCTTLKAKITPSVKLNTAADEVSILDIALHDGKHDKSDHVASDFVDAEKTGPKSAVYPVYAILIPPLQLEKAMNLYGLYREARLDEIKLDNVSDLSSVMSFEDGATSPSSDTEARCELRSYDGKVVKRRRNSLTPKRRAEVALVWALGSCQKCHMRKAPCPLEHHDMSGLERHYDKNTHGSEYTSTASTMDEFDLSFNIARPDAFHSPHPSGVSASHSSACSVEHLESHWRDDMMEHLVKSESDEALETESNFHKEKLLSDRLSSSLHSYESFKAWLKDPGDSSSLYWVTGKSGSGKSTLMRYIYDAPETKRYLKSWQGQELTQTSISGQISSSDRSSLNEEQHQLLAAADGATPAPHFGLICTTQSIIPTGDETSWSNTTSLAENALLESKHKVSVSKPSYQRPKHERVFCKQCDRHPDGFRGEHELRRHQDREHKSLIKKWVCIEPISGGRLKPILPLSKCKSCGAQRKKYDAYYNAAAHLRRAHFKPKGDRKNTKASIKDTIIDDGEKRGGKGGGDWPPMSELKYWMKEVEEPIASEYTPTQSRQNEAETPFDKETYGHYSNSTDHQMLLLQSICMNTPPSFLPDVYTELQERKGCYTLSETQNAQAAENRQDPQNCIETETRIVKPENVPIDTPKTNRPFTFPKPDESMTRRVVNIISTEPKLFVNEMDWTENESGLIGTGFYPGSLLKEPETWTASVSPSNQKTIEATGRDSNIVPRTRQPRKITTTEDANFQCHVKGCGKLFARSYNFKTHLEAHDSTREYPFPCPIENCNKKFLRMTDLQRHHQSVHMKNRNHRCSSCSRCFARKDTLRRHLKDCCPRRFAVEADGGSNRLHLPLPQTFNFGEQSSIPTPPLGSLYEYIAGGDNNPQAMWSH